MTTSVPQAPAGPPWVSTIQRVGTTSPGAAAAVPDNNLAPSERNLCFDSAAFAIVDIPKGTVSDSVTGQTVGGGGTPGNGVSCVKLQPNVPLSSMSLGTASTTNRVAPWSKPALPAPATFNDSSAHVLFSVTIPTPSTVTVRTGVHGWLYSDAGDIVAVVYYGDSWGFSNLTGTPANRSAAADRGWSFQGGAAAMNVTFVNITGTQANFQANLNLPPDWTGLHTYSAFDLVKEDGSTYQTPNGGLATDAPTGSGSTGGDGVTWVRISTTTTPKTVWRVTDITVETATT